jgi:xylulokinase
MLLGIDIGTSSTKAVLVTSEGEVIDSAVRTHSVSMPQPGWFEQDADEIWWADFKALSNKLLRDRNPSSLAGICISGLGPCLLVADEAGVPLRPAILYGVDTRSTEEIKELNERYGEDAILARCGSPLTTQAVGPKILWVQRHEPSTWSRVRRFFMANSYIVWRLTGEYVLDHSSASQCDPLYDIERTTWAEDWAEEVGKHLEYPALLWPQEIAGTVLDSVSQETGIPSGTPVAVGTIDAWSEALGAGVRNIGDAMVMYGTTMFFVDVVDRPYRDRHLWNTVGTFPGTWTLAGGMATSGAIISWFEELTTTDINELLQEASAVPPGSDGLLVLPYFSGERTPLFDPEARGVIAGLTLGHSRGALTRALLEGTAYGVRNNLEAFTNAGAKISRLVAVGGGTSGDLWPQIVSDVTGQMQHLPTVGIGAAYGDAYLAGLATEKFDLSTDWTRISKTIMPDTSTTRRYDQLFSLYKLLYAVTVDVNHTLAEIGREIGRDSTPSF